MVDMEDRDEAWGLLRQDPEVLFLPLFSSTKLLQTGRAGENSWANKVRSPARNKTACELACGSGVRNTENTTNSHICLKHILV